jgi:NADH:ubiquinone reductase (non-electrogenic)
MGGNKPRLVILGTGWASYSLLKGIDKSLYRPIVISPRNHFLFTPLLASTTVGTLEFRFENTGFTIFIFINKKVCIFRSIIEPIRNYVFEHANDLHLSSATSIDFTNKSVVCQSALSQQLQYK